MFVLFFIRYVLGEDKEVINRTFGKSYAYGLRMTDRRLVLTLRALLVVLDASFWMDRAIQIDRELERRAISSRIAAEKDAYWIEVRLPHHQAQYDKWNEEMSPIHDDYPDTVITSSDGGAQDTLQYSYVSTDKVKIDGGSNVIGRKPRVTWTADAGMYEKFTVFEYKQRPSRVGIHVEMDGTETKTVRNRGLFHVAKSWYRKNVKYATRNSKGGLVPDHRMRITTKGVEVLPWSEARDLSELDEFTGFVINEDGTFNSEKGRRKVTIPIKPDVLSVDRLEAIIIENDPTVDKEDGAYVYELACRLMTMLTAAKFEDVIRRSYGIPGLAREIAKSTTLGFINTLEYALIPEMADCEPARAINDTYDRTNRLMKGTVHYEADPEDDEEDLDSNDYLYAYRVLTSLDAVDMVTHSGKWSKLFPRSMTAIDFGQLVGGANSLDELEDFRLALKDIKQPDTFLDPSGEGVRMFWMYWQRRMKTLVHRSAVWQVFGPNRTKMGDLYRLFMEVRDAEGPALWLPRHAAEHYKVPDGEVIEFHWELSNNPEWRAKPIVLAQNLNRVRRYILANDKVISSIEKIEYDGDVTTLLINLK
jgi:hypothetical protein